MDEDFKDFERLCQKYNFSLIKEARMITNTELFNFFKDAKKFGQPAVTKKEFVEKPSQIFANLKQPQKDIIKALSMTPMTNKQLSIETGYATRTIFTHTKILKINGFIKKEDKEWRLT